MVATIIMFLLIVVPLWGGLIYLFILIVKALRKYLKPGKIRKETAAVRKSLGEVLKPLSYDTGVCGGASGHQQTSCQQMGKRGFR